LVLLWVALVPGILLTHIAIGQLLGPLSNLPNNIVEGFDDTFKFAYLKSKSETIGVVSVEAMAKCNYNPNISGCPSSPPSNSTAVNTQPEKDQLTNTFSTALDIVRRVTNDIYFGIPDLQPTATNLNEIVTAMNQINGSMPCGAVIVSYCSIWQNAGTIVSGIGQVDTAINTFKNSKEVKAWNDNEQFFIFLHVLPYFTVIAMVFFTFYHWKGGVCCCCSGGSRCACLALIPFFLFWCVSFLIYVIVFVAGYLTKNHKDKVNIGELNGNPNLEQVVEHMQAAFPEFWGLVFADMESALKILFAAAFFLTIANVLIGLFSMCECCCRPFKKEPEAIKEKENV
jgi:hypothetical protein